MNRGTSPSNTSGSGSLLWGDSEGLLSLLFRRSFKLSLLLLLLVSGWGQAQDKLPLQADTLFSKAAYFVSIGSYKMVLSQAKDSAIICHCKTNLAAAYGLLNDLKNAEETYRELIRNCNTTPTVLQQFARILQKNGEYEKARKLYASCYQADSTDVFSYQNMHFCDTVKQAMDRISEVYLDNVLPVNTAFDDMLTDANRDTLSFLSSRKTPGSGSRLLYNNQYPYQVFNWYPGKKKPELAMSLRGEYTCSDLEGREMYFTITEPVPANPVHSRTVLYRARKSGNIYEEPLKFAFDDGSSNFGHPHLSPDGTLFFFVSDKPGGAGGTDVYMCRKTGSKWSEPVALGSQVNTPDNELFPFYVGEGLLLFSSNGKAGFGGYDVYGVQLRNGLAERVVHLPLPVNSRGDDLNLRWDNTKKLFYISSNRIKGKGGLDIYRLQQFSIETLKKSF